MVVLFDEASVLMPRGCLGTDVFAVSPTRSAGGKVLNRKTPSLAIRRK